MDNISLHFVIVFCRVLKMPLLLSDSHLHLFLQTQLSVAKMEACVQGQTSYTVAEAIQCYVYETHFPLEDESKSLCDCDCERCACVFSVFDSTSHSKFKMD